MIRRRCGRLRRGSAWTAAWLLALLFYLSAPERGLAEGAGCALVSDEQKPLDRVLRCGGHLTIRTEIGSRYQLIGPPTAQPNGVKLESGALLIEYKPTERRRIFQILTPHAIAAVRGTTWAVDVASGTTATLVLQGVVEVKRPGTPKGALLRAGEGADISAESGPIVVKRWPQPRVDALLARLGR